MSTVVFSFFLRASFPSLQLKRALQHKNGPLWLDDDAFSEPSLRSSNNGTIMINGYIIHHLNILSASSLGNNFQYGLCLNKM